MGRRSVTKEELREFHQTPNGRSKYIWMYAGMLISFMSSLGVSILIINANRLPSPLYFYCALFVLLVLVVLGGELIGVYFGALEQFIYNKRQKKVLKIDE